MTSKNKHLNKLTDLNLMHKKAGYKPGFFDSDLTAWIATSLLPVYPALTALHNMQQLLPDLHLTQPSAEPA